MGQRIPIHFNYCKTKLKYLSYVEDDVFGTGLCRSECEVKARYQGPAHIPDDSIINKEIMLPRNITKTKYIYKK